MPCYKTVTVEGTASDGLRWFRNESFSRWPNEIFTIFDEAIIYSHPRYLCQRFFGA